MIYQVLGYPILKEIYKKNLSVMSLLLVYRERFGARSFQKPMLDLVSVCVFEYILYDTLV